MYSLDNQDYTLRTFSDLCFLLKMTTCPGRNYCDPSQSGCGAQNHGSTWFYTNQDATYDCVSPCLSAPFGSGQRYCNDHAHDYGGGTFQTYCYSAGSGCESNRICTRTGWNDTNMLNCCLGNLNDVGSCDPTWCPQNLTACTGVLSTYCGQEQHVASDPTCVQFCSQTENKVYCDPAMIQYCTSNPNDPLCSCLSNQVTVPKPECFDVPCTQSGYQTATMITDAMNCGAYCAQYIECVNAGQCNVNNNLFTQSCGNQPGPTPTPTPDGIPTWIWVALGIGLLALVLIIGVVLLLGRRHRQAAQEIQA